MEGTKLSVPAAVVPEAITTIKLGSRIYGRFRVADPTHLFSEDGAGQPLSQPLLLLAERLLLDCVVDCGDVNGMASWDFPQTLSMGPIVVPEVSLCDNLPCMSGGLHRKDAWTILISQITKLQNLVGNRRVLYLMSHAA